MRRMRRRAARAPFGDRVPPLTPSALPLCQLGQFDPADNSNALESFLEDAESPSKGSAAGRQAATAADSRASTPGARGDDGNTAASHRPLACPPLAVLTPSPSGLHPTMPQTFPKAAALRC